jgi:hypothetical protein
MEPLTRARPGIRRHTCSGSDWSQDSQSPPRSSWIMV